MYHFVVHHFTNFNAESGVGQKDLFLVAVFVSVSASDSVPELATQPASSTLYRESSLMG